jgi:hypothetical protein
MTATAISSRLVPGTRAEQLRIRADLRDGRPVVRLDLLEPLTKHASAMTVAGRAVFIPVEQVAALCEALHAAQVAAGDPPAREGEF